MAIELRKHGNIFEYNIVEKTRIQRYNVNLYMNNCLSPPYKITLNNNITIFSANILLYIYTYVFLDPLLTHLLCIFYPFLSKRIVFDLSSRNGKLCFFRSKQNLFIGGESDSPRR